MKRSEEREMKELLERCSPRTLDVVWKLLRHMSGQELPAADLDELRDVLDRHGFNLPDFNLA